MRTHWGFKRSDGLYLLPVQDRLKTIDRNGSSYDHACRMICNEVEPGIIGYHVAFVDFELGGRLSDPTADKTEADFYSALQVQEKVPATGFIPLRILEEYQVLRTDLAEEAVRKCNGRFQNRVFRKYGKHLIK